MELWKSRSILRFNNDSATFCEDSLIREEEISLFVNGEFSVSFACMPNDLEALAVGYLFCHGLLYSKAQIGGLSVANGRIDLTIISAPSKPRLAPTLTLKPNQAYALWMEFDEACVTFRHTGAVHAVGLAGANGLVLVKEDTARHNALAKVLGAALLSDIHTNDKALIFSGRMSSELMKMVIACDAPILLCHGAATFLAVERADELGITLAGFVKNGYMNLYTHSERFIQTVMEP